MITDFFLLAATDTSSAAYKIGTIIGVILISILMIGLPILFIVSLIKLISTKNKNWIIGLVLSGLPLLALVCIFIFGIYAGLQEAISKRKPGIASVSGMGRIVNVPDSKLSLQIPSNWRELKNINADASLSLGNPSREEYFIVLTETKIDLEGNLQDFSDITCDAIFASLTNATMSEPKTLTINGLSAVQREISGSIDRIKISYLHTSLEGKEQYYQLLGWSVVSRKTQAFKAIHDVVHSCKE
jgi:hypothetical protein